MKTILIETTGELHYVDIPEKNVDFYLGGAPLTFCGTIPELDAVVLIKEDSRDAENSYIIPGVERFKGRALVIKTDVEGIPVDIDLREYETWYDTNTTSHEK